MHDKQEFRFHEGVSPFVQSKEAKAFLASSGEDILVAARKMLQMLEGDSWAIFRHWALYEKSDPTIKELMFSIPFQDELRRLFLDESVAKHLLLFVHFSTAPSIAEINTLAGFLQLRPSSRLEVLDALECVRVNKITELGPEVMRLRKLSDLEELQVGIKRTLLALELEQGESLTDRLGRLLSCFRRPN